MGARALGSTTLGIWDRNLLETMEVGDIDMVSPYAGIKVHAEGWRCCHGCTPRRVTGAILDHDIWNKHTDGGGIKIRRMAAPFSHKNKCHMEGS